MRILLVHPRFPTTYWGFQHSIRLIGKQATLPPLGLVTLAAWLPTDWEVRLVDQNVRTLSDDDILWADAVLIGGMLIQAEAMTEVVARSSRLGRRTVVGGPVATTCPELVAGADVVFRGEVEGRQIELGRAIASEAVGMRLDPPKGSFPSMEGARVPRYELLELDRYVSLSLQYSRGCPFACEFCDVVEIFGRRPRVKSPEQVLGELERIERLGYRGSLFLVDDNFIGNRAAVRRLLPRLAEWQQAHGMPFELYTEASVNLASDPPLIRGMVEAGFSAVFLGIESPSQAALADAGKRQNLAIDLGEAVARLTREGLEVMGGFIVGFDTDDPQIFQSQLELIERTPIALAMVGVLHALPGTALWHRLGREGRLRATAAGDQFGRPNFVPRMGEAQLLRGYRYLMRALYRPEAYYRRCLAFVRQAGARPQRRARGLADYVQLVRTMLHVGVLSPRRMHYWRLLGTALWRAPHALPRAVAHAAMGEHLIRYTTEQVLPALDRALGELLRPTASAVTDGATAAPLLPTRLPVRA